MRRRRVALHRRLFVRLMAGTLVIAGASIAATAWLAERTTTNALRRSEGRSVSADARIYDALDGFAATHRSWRGVDPLLAHLTSANGQRIVLTAPDRGRLPGTAPPEGPLPALASAVVDPLQTDVLAFPRNARTEIDPRALGPFRVGLTQRRTLGREARRAVACMRAYYRPAHVVRLPGGRPWIALPPPSAPLTHKIVFGCDAGRLLSPTPREAHALTRLNQLVDRCLARRRRGPVRIGLGLAFSALPAEDKGCVLHARRLLLRPWVAEPALLFITTPTGATGPLNLSGPNRRRLALVAMLVLGLSALLAALLTSRVTRPLRRLTDAVDAGGEASVPVTVDDEVGRLTRGFNEMGTRRRQLETQRREMVRDIAHELRGPLSNMGSWLEASEDGLVDTDDELRALLLDETHQLQHIVADLADLADLDAGTLALHLEALAVADVIEATVAGQRLAAEIAEVRLRIDVAGDPTTDADPVRLRQALGNVVANAIRHTEPGGQVTVTAERHGDQIVLEVSDTGSGIAEADLPRVFDRFWRGDPARGRMTGGSGLGLAITRRLVVAHGGEISVQSRLGCGTTVTLRLPAGGGCAVPVV